MKSKAIKRNRTIRGNGCHLKDLDLGFLGEQVNNMGSARTPPILLIQTNRR